MDELFKGVFTAPVATLFIVGGMLFLLVAVLGNISGKVEPGPRARIISGVFGLAFILVGVLMHVMQSGLNLPASSTASSTSTKPDQSVVMPQTSTLSSSEEASRALQNTKEFQTVSPAQETVPKPETTVVSTSIKEKIPDWVPMYPAVNIENLFFREGSARKRFGSFSFTTPGRYQEVITFYVTQLEAAGWEHSGYGSNIIAKSASNGRTITVNVSTITKDKKELTKALVSFEKVKPWSLHKE